MNPMLEVLLAEANAKAKALREARSGEAHFSAAGPGQRGMMLILDDANPMVKQLARALGLEDGWKIDVAGTRVGGKTIYGAYNSGDRLALAEFKDDLVGDDEEGDK